jgi:hypothetical protein
MKSSPRADEIFAARMKARRRARMKRRHADEGVAAPMRCCRLRGGGGYRTGLFSLAGPSETGIRPKPRSQSPG